MGEATRPGTTVNTDEWGGYDGLPEVGAAGDGLPRGGGMGAGRRRRRGGEVHDNTLEGLWTGLRNFLRPFRGVSKKYLQQYVAIFEWGYNVKRATPQSIRALLGLPITTFRPP